jgi:hypothetical protein
MSNIQYGKTPKTIAKLLHAKLADWLASIDDRQVREIAAANAIVTGGAIASMLLGESVNDYDVYFKTPDSTLAVAEYYAETFTKPEVAATLVVTPEGTYRVKMVMSGNPGIVEPEGAKEPEDSLPEYTPVYVSENAISLTGDVQVIVRFCGSPEEIHKNFDFVHATNWYDYAENKVVTNTEALQALLTRTLVYRGSLYPLCSLFRVKKFVQRGWNIGAGEILKMAFQVNELDLRCMTTLKEQLMGVDSMYMTFLLREIEKELGATVSLGSSDSLPTCHIVKLIDKVFG